LCRYPVERLLAAWDLAEFGPGSGQLDGCSDASVMRMQMGIFGGQAEPGGKRAFVIDAREIRPL